MNSVPKLWLKYEEDKKGGLVRCICVKIMRLYFFKELFFVFLKNITKFAINKKEINNGK